MTDTVRRATLQNLERVVPLFDAYRQFYGKPSDLTLAREFLAARLSRDESVVFLAEGPNGNAVGFVQLFPSFSSVRAAPIYVLNDLFVAPSARRRGIARLLLKAAAAFARDRGAVRMTLSTATTNFSAQKLYEEMGWKRDEEFCEYGLSL